MQDSNNINESGFQLLLVDFSENLQSHLVFLWKNNDYIIDLKSDKYDISENSYRKNGRLQISKEWKDKLNELSFNFTYSGGKIFLKDIFIYPNFHLVNKFNATKITKKDEYIFTEDMVKGKDFEDFIIKNDKIVIYGQEKSGKTSISKFLFQAFFTKGFLPIYIDIKNINSFSDRSLDKHMDFLKNDQYEFRELNTLNDEGEIKYIYIVDNYGIFNIDKEKQGRLVSFLNNKNSKIILFTSEDLVTDGISGEIDLITDFIRLEIMEVNHSLKRSLAINWLRLRGFSYENSQDYDHILQETLNAISLVLDNGLMPKHPFFVLLVLQQIENTQIVDLTSASYAHLCQSHIIDTISKSIKLKKSSNSLDFYTIEQILIDIGKLMCIKNSNKISSFELMQLIENYNKIYRDNIHYSDFKEIAELSDLLLENKDLMQFKYKYFYHFFVAKYLQTLKTDSDLYKNILDAKIDQIYAEDNANIIVFLGFLNKDNQIINKLISASEKMLPEIKPSDFAKSMGFINEKNHNESILELPSTDTFKNGYTYDEKRDITGENNTNSDIDEKEADIYINAQSHLNSAFKILDVLGQIVRSFAGSIDGVMKEYIVNECYLLSLRIISLATKGLEYNSKEIFEVFKSRFPDKFNGKNDERDINLVISLLVQNIATTIISRLSFVLGARKLSLTYLDVLNNTTELKIPYQIIDLSIHLDHFRSFPTKKIDDIIDQTRRNFFARSVLRRLIWRHLYLYRVPYHIKHSICSKIDIAITKATDIDYKGRDTKMIKY